MIVWVSRDVISMDENKKAEVIGHVITDSAVQLKVRILENGSEHTIPTIGIIGFEIPVKQGETVDFSWRAPAERITINVKAT